MRGLTALVGVAVTGLTMTSAEMAARQPLSTPGGAPFVIRQADPAVESASPDGAFVTFRKGRAKGQVWLREISSGAERLVVDVPGTVDTVIWSPDGRHLAFSVTPPDQGAVPEIKIETVATSEIVPRNEIGKILAWTADDRLLFSRLTGVWGLGWYSAPSQSGEATLIWPAAQTLLSQVRAISPDGRSLAVTHSAGGISRLQIVSPATGRIQTLLSVDSTECCPVFSPDSRLLAYVAAKRGNDGAGLYVAPLDRLPLQDGVRIAPLEGLPDDVSEWWTTTGGLVVHATTTTETHVFKVPIDPSTAHETGPWMRLTRGSFGHGTPAISPDSRMIAFRSGDAPGLHVMDNSGVETKTFGSGYLAPVAWISAREVLVTHVPGGGLGVLSLDTDLVRGIGVAGGLFSQAHQEVLYIAGNSLKARSLNGGPERTVATVDRLTGFVVSPDGKHIAYGHRPVATDAGDGELLLMTADGRPERRLLSTPRGTPSPHAWSPDGRFLLYYDPNGVPSIVNVSTGEFWKLIDGKDQPDWSNYDASWAPDGSFIALSGDETRASEIALAVQGVTFDAIAHLARSAK